MILREAWRILFRVAVLESAMVCPRANALWVRNLPLVGRAMEDYGSRPLPDSFQ